MTVGVTFLHEIHSNWKLDKSLYFMKQAAGHLILLQSTIAIILSIIRIQEVWWLIVDCILCCCGPTATTIWTVVGCCWALSLADLPWKFLPHQHVLCVVAAVVPPCTAITPLLVCILCPASWQSGAWRRANKSCGTCSQVTSTVRHNTASLTSTSSTRGVAPWNTGTTRIVCETM